MAQRRLCRGMPRCIALLQLRVQGGHLTGSLGDELVEVSRRLSTVAARADDSAFKDTLSQLMEAAETVGRAWSGSNIGFHADVYYEGLAEPPARCTLQLRVGIPRPVPGHDW